MRKLESLIGSNRTILVKPSLEIERIIPWETAIVLVLFKNARTLINRETEVIRTVHQDFPKPLVIANYAYYEHHSPRYFKSDQITSKYRIKQRDNHTCQYCGEPGETIDHIIPKALGGTSTWGNLCVACQKCNQHKGRKTLQEVGYKMPKIPNSIPIHRKQHSLQQVLYETLEELV